MKYIIFTLVHVLAEPDPADPYYSNTSLFMAIGSASEYSSIGYSLGLGLTIYKLARDEPTYLVLETILYPAKNTVLEGHVY